jgi:hypothetical protein
MKFFTVVFAVSLLGFSCGNALCDKSAETDLTYKAGTCTGVLTGNLLGTGMVCSMKSGQCNESEQKTLSAAMDCLGKLEVCSESTKASFVAAEKSCVSSLLLLSDKCKMGFDVSFPVEIQDAGVDAGVVDAGPQSVNDGGNGLKLIGVADETQFALAWSQVQPGDMATISLVTSDSMKRLSEQNGILGTKIDLLIPDASIAAARFFIVGRQANGEIAVGSPGVPVVDAGTSDGGSDAGTGAMSCMRSSDCAVDRVCDLLQCKPQSCPFGMTNTCPAGYQCLNGGVCTRTSMVDAGNFNFDSGVASDGGVVLKIPFISNEVALSLGAPQISQFVVGGFSSRRPDIAGIDSARLAISLEQEGILTSHFSTQRGQDLVQDQGTSSPVDTLGSRLHITYNPESRFMFACYTVGRGLRVQRSGDYGKTWGTAAVTVELDPDGGVANTIADCDIAPWKNGGAIVVTTEDDSVAIRTVSTGLSLSPAEPAFLSYTNPDGGPGGIFNPARPAIATLPSDNIVHISFTGIRQTPSGNDSEPYAVARAPTTGGIFSPAKRISPTESGQAQDFTAIVVDPKTKRALAAYTSVIPGPGNVPISTVYTSLCTPNHKDWGSGADLDVLYVKDNTSVLFPTRPANDVWYAFSPQLAVTPQGKIFLSFVAGPHPTNSGDYRQYMVPFDFNLQAPFAGGLGWYVRPVVQVSTKRVFDPRAPSGAAQPNVSAITADTQISVYGTFIQGVGQNGEIEGTAAFYSRP